MAKVTMFFYIFVFVFLVLNNLQIPCLAMQPITTLSADESALFALKHHLTSVEPSQMLNTNWTNATSVCSWIGVKCGHRHRRVVELNIFNMSLSGTLPPQLGNLSFLIRLNLNSNVFSGSLPEELSSLRRLRFVNLNFNHFQGPVPSWFGFLPRLERLVLRNNSFSGLIPRSLSNLSSLETLDLYGNSIGGEIPRELGKLSSLQNLYLGSNKLEGAIPEEIGNLTMLNYLILQSNNLTGVLPREVGKLHHLEYLYLGSNNFHGTIPPELFNISALQGIMLTSNALSGNLPSDFGVSLPLLEYLYLDFNNLSGPIPASISNCSSLEVLQLNSNKFSGYMPHFLGNSKLRCIQLVNNRLQSEPDSPELTFITSLANSKSLDRLDVDDNPLNGIIPASVGNLSSKLMYFELSYCNIRGGIPPEIGNLSALGTLDLSNNELTGNIPSTIKQLRNLQGISLWNNYLRGSIPETLCDLQSLFELNLGHNNFSGPIPECLGGMTTLRHLSLDSNRLSSSIPSSLWLNRDLLSLDLSSNSLNGLISPEIRNLQAAIYINLSMNQLSKHIPTEIGSLLGLATLSLARNRLEGSIPETVGNMTSLVALDFSYNNLSGTIPTSLQELQSLKQFNVSFNDLSGEIPSGGPFKNFTLESYKANTRLCGFPVSHDSSCGTVSIQRSWTKNRTVHVLLILVVVVVSIAFICLTVMLVRSRRRNKEANTRPGDNALSARMPERVSYYELLQATEQFSESNLLGSGSFGSVYKGILVDGKLLAIKVFNLQSEGAFKSFDRECEVLRNVRHRNIVRVISSCSNQNFKALLLEYMPNGSLDDILYSKNHFLDLMQRLNIMIDVASALEYLHHGYLATIVHCDLKPSNVLLDEEMTARVSDFGIAKLLGDEESSMLTSTLATLGYIAPEYGFEGLVSTKCDVYSYGIMLMEIFTRRRPSDDMFSGDLSLKSWVESSVPKSLNLVVDATLLNPEDKNLDTNRMILTSVLELALKCTTKTPGDRLDMPEVLVELQKIKRQLFK